MFTHISQYLVVKFNAHATTAPAWLTSNQLFLGSIWINNSQKLELFWTADQYGQLLTGWITGPHFDEYVSTSTAQGTLAIWDALTQAEVTYQKHRANADW